MPSCCFSTKPMVWKERVNKLATVTLPVQEEEHEDGSGDPMPVQEGDRDDGSGDQTESGQVYILVKPMLTS